MQASQAFYNPLLALMTLPHPADVFLSASEDGTVREFDVRQRPVAVHRDALAGDDSNVLGGCWAFVWPVAVVGTCTGPKVLGVHK